MTFFSRNRNKRLEHWRNNPLFIQSSDALLIIDEMFLINAFNEVASEKYNLQISDLSKHVSEFIDLKKNNPNLLKKLDVKAVKKKLIWLKSSSKRAILAEVTIIPIDDELYVLNLKNIIPSHEQSITNKIAEKMFAHSTEAIMVTDHKSRIILVNDAFEEATGFKLEEVINKTPSILKSGVHDKTFYEKLWATIKEQGFWSGEVWNRKKNGELYLELLTICAITNSSTEAINYIAMFTDITEQKSVEEKMRFLAMHDPLTGVANRYNLNQKLDSFIETAKLHNQQLAVLFLDLDRFKYVNDTLGHSFGDLLLIEISKRLKNLLSPKDVIARLGGDEFVIVMPNVAHAKEAIFLAEAITESLSSSYMLDRMEVVVTTSIGISIFPHDGDTLEELLISADKAMYQAKGNGRNNYEVFYRDLTINEQDKMKKEMNLRKAIEKNELQLYFQPIINTKSKEIDSVEALIRWQSSEIGMVPANELIEIAEETGIIISITDWIITEACNQIKILHLNSYSQLKMAINISGLYFQQSNFIKKVTDIFEHTNVSPYHIIFELTESVIMVNNLETIDKLTQLKKMGITISIDDFGTGYSSLSYLSKFPIDKLKVDQSFIKGMLAIKEDENIVKAIINLGKSLNLELVAEGVESLEQVTKLKEINCNYIQGYYYSKPIPIFEMIDFLEYWEYNKGEK